MTDATSIVPENKSSSRTPEKKFIPKGTFPPIAGFRPRVWAFSIDLLLMSAIGTALGFAFSSILFKFGPYTTLLGLLYIFPYYGIMNSKSCNGQTLGKKWLKIAVRNANNQPISLGRSFARIALLVGPYFLAGIIGLFSRNKYVGYLENTLTYGWWAAILYLIIFNKIPRQGLHDLILHTYVVDLKKKKLLNFPVTERKHWVISFVCIFVVYLCFLLAAIIPQNNLMPADIQSIGKTLMTDPRFFSANTSAITHSDSNGTAQILKIGVWYKGKITQTNFPKVSDDIVKVAFASVKDLDSFDYIQVIVTSEFSLGFTYIDQQFNITHSIADWRKIVNSNSNSG